MRARSQKDCRWFSVLFSEPKNPLSGPRLVPFGLQALSRAWPEWASLPCFCGFHSVFGVHCGWARTKVVSLLRSEVKVKVKVKVVARATHSFTGIPYQTSGARDAFLYMELPYRPMPLPVAAWVWRCICVVGAKRREVATLAVR